MIKVSNLKKCYSQGELEVQALAGVDLEVKKGEFVSIMGSSGSGKSTLMNILGCLDKPTSGDYILDGINISKVKDSQLSQIRNKKIGFVFQSFNLLPKLNALENVELPMVYAGIDSATRRKKAENALEWVGLAERMKHKPNEMSGGQRQRVAIARALVNDPAIILADEPTGNLDSKSTFEIIDIFQRLNEGGATIVMVTHEPDVAEYTKRIVTFKDGHKISDEIVENPKIAGGEM
ncbi:MAG: ABC transporter ATP-binding protein [Clostridia bacterium]|nr:ABC transporter ATP-binding protein [Clostridia bacterium]